MGDVNRYHVVGKGWSWVVPVGQGEPKGIMHEREIAERGLPRLSGPWRYREDALDYADDLNSGKKQS